MKNLSEISKELDAEKAGYKKLLNNNELCKNYPKTWWAHSRVFEKKINFLTEVSEYIESSPRAEYIEKSYQKLCIRREAIRCGYGVWLDHHPEFKEMKSPKTKYDTLMGLKVVVRQIAALEYILNI